MPTVIVRPSFVTTASALAAISPSPVPELDHVETELPAKDLDRVETTAKLKAPVLPDAPIKQTSFLAVLLSALVCGLVATVVVVFA